jgi:hypothetical protein
MACHGTSHLCLHKLLKKISYELLTGNKPNVSYFQDFGSKCYVLYKRSKSCKLLLKSMKVSCLVMIQTLAHTVFLM